MVHGFCCTIFCFYHKSMRKVLIFLTALLIASQLQAQDLVLLNRIKATNEKIETLEADIDNHYSKSGSVSYQYGKLYFVSPKEFAAYFNTGKYMIVNEKMIKMNIRLFQGTFGLKENGIMQSLGNVFLYGIQGRIQELSDENSYNMETQTETDCHIITCTNSKKKLIGIGYKQVIFKYHTESLLLKEIVLINYKGNKDTYTLSDVKCNVPIDKQTFLF